MDIFAWYVFSYRGLCCLNLFGFFYVWEMQSAFEMIIIELCVNLFLTQSPLLLRHSSLLLHWAWKYGSEFWTIFWRRSFCSSSWQTLSVSTTTINRSSNTSVCFSFHCVCSDTKIELANWLLNSDSVVVLNKPRALLGWIGGTLIHYGDVLEKKKDQRYVSSCI